MDGEIDYSKYAYAELLEAKRSINARQFPKNFANLEAAIVKFQPDADEAHFGGSAEPDRPIWAVLDGPEQYQSLPIKEAALYIIVFGLAGFSVAFVFEFFFALLGWQIGSIVRVIYYSIAVVPIAILFTNKHKRLPTTNEFTGLVAATYISYALVGTLLVWISEDFVVPVPETFGGLIILAIPVAVIVLIDFLFFFLAFRFPMRWTMQFCLRRLSNSQTNTR